jgi:hypothetical protein
MDAERFGALIALLAGDERDEPLRCAWCNSPDVERDPRRDWLNCRVCSGMTTMAVAADARTRTLRARVFGR